MKKRVELEEGEDDDNKKELEIIKAVAQAWHSHSSSSSSCSKPTKEFDAYRRNFEGKPSRFKVQAMSKQSVKVKENFNGDSPNWDFKQSLWDSYEIVTMAKKLETTLGFDDPFAGLEDMSRAKKRIKESKNSLRNLFRRVTSRRFNESDIPHE